MTSYTVHSHNTLYTAQLSWSLTNDLILLTQLLNIFISIDEDGHFGQEQVPLTDEIKEILEEYPDGQIFKVSD